MIFFPSPWEKDHFFGTLNIFWGKAQLLETPAVPLKQFVMSQNRIWRLFQLFNNFLPFAPKRHHFFHPFFCSQPKAKDDQHAN
jgi:hypothetical protein